MLRILITGVGVFAAMLALQLGLWRLVRVRREILWLLVLYLVFPVLTGIAVYSIGLIEVAPLLAVTFLYLALAAAYIQTYPALRENIPSFRILLLIDAHANAALSADEIVNQMRNEGLFHTKVDDLVNDGLAQRAPDGRLVLTRYGAVLADVFRRYRTLLGLKIGHG